MTTWDGWLIFRLARVLAGRLLRQFRHPACIMQQGVLAQWLNY
jgi:hypothetical protein